MGFKNILRDLIKNLNKIMEIVVVIASDRKKATSIAQASNGILPTSVNLNQGKKNKQGASLFLGEEVTIGGTNGIIKFLREKGTNNSFTPRDFTTKGVSIVA